MSQLPQLEKCENCGGIIGAIESPMVWNERVVCAACFKRLSASDGLSPPIEQTLEQLAAMGSRRETPVRRTGRNLPPQTKLGKSVPIAPSTVRRGYIQRVGGRSFTFQMVLVGWTALMWGIALVLFLVSVYSQRQLTEAEWNALPSSEQAVRMHDKLQEMSDPRIAEAAKAGRGIGMMGVLSCPLSIWGIVALPLFIAAVATVDRTRTPK